MAHSEDLRSEANATEGWIEALRADWRQVEMTERQRALCEYADKLTRTPGEMGPEDLKPLRAVGLNDRGILDAVQVVGYFNYINRVADGLGVRSESEWAPDA